MARFTQFLRSHSQQPVWKQVLIVLGFETCITLITSLILRNLRQVSNVFFLGSIFFFIVAVVPVFIEIGGSAKIARSAFKVGQQMAPLLKEKQPIYERQARITYVFGLSGIISFVLSMITLGLM